MSAPPAGRRLTGARPSPRHVLAAATPHKPLAGAPPNWLWLPSKLSMWGNDQHGDCVSAEEAFCKACSGILISTAETERWASSHGVLEGADLGSVLDWMHAKGFAQDGNTYDDGGKLSVDWTSPSNLQSAISHGPVKIAVASSQLQQAAGNSNGWLGVGFGQDQNLDHCVSLCGYGTIAWLQQQLGGKVPSGIDGSKAAYALFTWNTIGTIDVPSMLAITGEAWLRSPNNVTVGTNPPTPDPVTTPPGPTPGPTPEPPGPPGPTPAGPTQAQVLAAVDATLSDIRRRVRQPYRGLMDFTRTQLDAAVKQLWLAHWAGELAGDDLPQGDFLETP